MARRRFGYVFERVLPGGGKTWCAQWSEKKRRLTRAFGPGKKGKKQAREFLAKVEQRLCLGTYETPMTIRESDAEVSTKSPALPTFVDFAEGLISRRFAAVKAPATVNLYRANLKALKSYLGEREAAGRTIAAKRLDQITPHAMSDYQVWRRTWRGDGDKTEDGKVAPIGNASINRDTAFASVVLSHAVVEGLIPTNPLRGFQKLKEPKRPRRYMSKGEAARVIMAAPECFRPYLTAALYTGARPCELKALRWRDVNFDTGKISVVRQKVGNVDALDLHPVLRAELERLRTSRGAPRPNAFILLDGEGRPWGRDVRREWNQTLENAGLAESALTPYSTRHSFAMHFLDQAGPVDLQSQLGHRNIETTMIYAGMKDERRKAGVLALDYGTAPEASDAKQAVAPASKAAGA